MATAQGLKRTLILPVIAGVLALATIGGYYAVQYASAGSKPAAVEVKQPSLEERLTPVAVAPQIIEKPAFTINLEEEITDFKQVEHLARYLTQELGYPLQDQDWNFAFNPKEKHLILAANANLPGSPSFTDYKKRTTYVMNNNFYKVISPLAHELGLVTNATYNEKLNRNTNVERLEGLAYSLEAAFLKKFEEESGLDKFFVYPESVYNEFDYATSLFSSSLDIYFQKSNKSAGGFLLVWDLAMLPPRGLENLKSELVNNKRLSWESDMALFKYIANNVSNEEAKSRIVRFKNSQELQLAIDVIKSRSTSMTGKYPHALVSDAYFLP